MDKGHDNHAMGRQFRGTGVYWTLIPTLVVAVLIVIGIIQNSQGVRLRYLVWTGSLSLAVALLTTITLTVALTTLVGVIWRRRRRHQLGDAVELRELRGRTPAPPLGVRGGDVSGHVARILDRPGEPRAPAAAPAVHYPGATAQPG